MKKAINYILLPLYLLWHGVMDRFKVKDDVVLLDNKQIQGAVEVDNIQAISDDILNNLKVGDVVRKKTDNMKHCYVVTYKEEKHGICLSYYDAGYLETVSYDYVEGHWVYNSKDMINLNEIGGLPEVTTEDNEKVLEVLAGAWSIGRKKVTVIAPPESTRLTTEEETAFNGGVFVNGNYLDIKNPIFMPITGRTDRGIVFGSGVDTFYIKSYNIVDHVISLQNYIYIEFNMINHAMSIYARQGMTLSCDANSGIYFSNINKKQAPKSEIDLSNLGSIITTSVGTGFYRNVIPYTDGIDNEDVIYVKMSNGGVYPCINDTTNSQLVIFNGIDFATDSVSVSKSWKIKY